MKTRIDRREGNFISKHFGASGRDDGVTKEDTLSPSRVSTCRPCGFSVQAIGSIRLKDNNGVRYRLTAMHGALAQSRAQSDESRYHSNFGTVNVVPSEGPVVSLIRTPGRGQTRPVSRWTFQTWQRAIVDSYVTNH